MVIYIQARIQRRVGLDGSDPLPMANLNFNKYAVVKWAKNRYWTPSPTNYTPPQEKFFINLIPSMLVYMGI